jgi:hypothetical protein
MECTNTDVMPVEAGIHDTMGIEHTVAWMAAFAAMTRTGPFEWGAR